MPRIVENLIVGGGKAGKTLAADLARAGREVVLVERGWIGGSCINVACIPTKTLVTSAEVASTVASAGEFGVHVDGWRVDMSAVTARRDDVVGALVQMNRDTLEGALGENFLVGEARFTGPRTVRVELASGEVRELTGERVFLNMGAGPSLPEVPGLHQARPLTSETVQRLVEVPSHVLVMGGGYIGVEFAQMLRRFGSRVTILQRGSRLLPNEDIDVAEALLQILVGEGVEVRLGATVKQVTGRSGEAVQILLSTASGEETVEGSHLLAAVGRAAKTADIGLELAGVQLNPHGFVQVNERLETSAESIWALGDVAGSPQFTHVSFDDYRIVKANVFGQGGRSTADRLIPHTVFVDPEIAGVGLTEVEARRRGMAYRLLKLGMAAVPRARTMSRTTGFLKALLATDSDAILGFAMVGPQASDVASVVQVAMLGGVPYTTLRDSILAHPTMGEALNLLFALTPSVIHEPVSV